MSLYDHDFYAWANTQAALLRTGQFDAADIANIVEEIESLARREKRDLARHLTTVILFMLLWTYLPGRRSESEKLRIEIPRRAVASYLEDSPSLRPQLAEALADAYEDAVLWAQLESGLSEDTFPTACPWTYDQIMTPHFCPQGESD